MTKVMLGILLILVLVKVTAPSAGADDSWRPVADLPTPRSNHAASVVDGRIYVLGGFGDGGMNVFMEYDPVTDQWRRVADMPTPRCDLAAAVVDGKIYAIGGYNGGSHSTVEEYDPTTDSWPSRAPMPTPRFGLAAVAVGGKIYAIGGTERGDSPSNAVEEYDPATDTWRSRAPMPTARYGLAADAATLSGKIYAIGGEYRNGRIQYLHTVEEYDPVTDTWRSRAPMPTPRYFHAAVTEGRRLYVLGGYNSDVGELATVEEYNPATDNWASRTPMPTARRGLAAVAVGGRIYAIGGEGGSQVVEEYVPFNYEEVPTVTVMSPNGGEYWSGTHTITWTATDPQSYPLTYTVYYSPNGGQTWTQLAAGLTEPSYLWDTTTVVDGTNYLIKVVASDGTHTNEDVSNAPFEIANALLYLTEWTQTYGGSEDEWARSVIETVDGGYALAGCTASYGAGGKDAWLVKTDAHGNMEWNQTYGGSYDDEAKVFVETADGGFALAGWTASYGAGAADAWLVKTDAHGEVEWTQTYGGSEGDWANTMIETADGGFALAGSTYSWAAGYSDAWLVKTDARGVMQWNQRYGDANADNNEVESVFETPDGGFFLAINSDYYSAGGYSVNWLVKTDVNGNEEWTRTFDPLYYFYSGIQTVDGGCAFVGYLGLVKTDANGNKEWKQNYGVRAYSVIQTTDGGFVLAGSDFWLAKTDNQGTMKWQQTYGGSGKDVAWSVIETVDGGYALAGWTTSYGAGASDLWLVKTISPETTLPSLSKPADLTCEEGTLGHLLTWTVGDRHPGTYTLYVNSVQVDSGLWVNGTITWYADGLAPGTNNITLVARDSFNNRASNTFWITVSTTVVPELSVPEDIVYAEGTTGHVIMWGVGDRYPGTYAIYINSGPVDSGSWTNGTIIWDVDGLASGTYNVTLVVWDAACNSVSDTVWVTVKASKTPPLQELPVIRILVLLSLVTLITLSVRKKP